MGPIFTTTTDAMGGFEFALNTNGTPVANLDLFASVPGRVDMYYYPSRAVTQDLAVFLALLSPQEASGLALGAGLQLTAGQGSISAERRRLQ